MPSNKKKNASRKGRTRRNIKQKYASRNPARESEVDGTSSAPPKLEDVISQADTAMETSEVETAVQLYTYASTILRQNLEDSSSSSGNATDYTVMVDLVLNFSKVLSNMAEAKVSMGDVDGARLDFSEAMNALCQYENIIEQVGEADGEKKKLLYMAQWKEAKTNIFLYMGQLTGENDALQCFQSAIADLKLCVEELEKGTPDFVASQVDENRSDDNDPLHCALLETRQRLCGAYCSIAELYLTDLCNEIDAETQCEAALDSALLIDSPLFPPDVPQAMANLRLSQNRGIEAVGFILDAYGRMKVGCEAMSHLVGLSCEKRIEEEELSESTKAKEIKDDALDAATSLPSFEFRCQSAKILMECSSLLSDSNDMKEQEQESYCISSAIHVLGSLMAENDEVAEIWFLLGCAFSMNKNYLSSRDYFEQSLEMLKKVKEDMNGMESEYKDIEEQIMEVERRISELTLSHLNGMEEN